MRSDFSLTPMDHSLSVKKAQSDISSIAAPRAEVQIADNITLQFGALRRRQRTEKPLNFAEEWIGAVQKDLNTSGEATDDAVISEAVNRLTATPEGKNSLANHFFWGSFKKDEPLQQKLLVALANHPDENVRHFFIKPTSLYKLNELSPEAAKALNDSPYEEVRAAMALRPGLYKESWKEVLERHLADRSIEVRVAAIRGAVPYHPDAISRLARLADDTNPDIQCAIIDGLGSAVENKIYDPEKLGALTAQDIRATGEIIARLSDGDMTPQRLYDWAASLPKILTSVPQTELQQWGPPLVNLLERVLKNPERFHENPYHHTRNTQELFETELMRNRPYDPDFPDRQKNGLINALNYLDAASPEGSVVRAVYDKCLKRGHHLRD